MKNALFVVLLTSCFLHPANGQPSGQNPSKGAQAAKAEALGSKEKPLFVMQEKSPDEKDGDAKRDEREIKNLDINGKSLKFSEKSLKVNEETAYETGRAATAAVYAAAFAALAFLATIVISSIQAWISSGGARKQLRGYV